MKRISSNSTFFHKRVFPVLWIGVVLTILGVAVFAKIQGGDVPPPAFLVPVVMLVVGFTIFRALLSDLADEVSDAGNALVVRFGSEQDRIPLENIINVSCTTMVNPPRATLLLRRPGKFGKRIAFSPIREGRGFTLENKLIDALVERIDAARLESAKR